MLIDGQKLNSGHDRRKMHIISTFPFAAAVFLKNESVLVIGGFECIGISTNVVNPPAAETWDL